MAVQRDAIQLFENCLGINLKNSALTRQPNEYVSLQNFEFSQSNSIRGRKGIQGVGARAAFIGTHTYKFFNRDTGATEEQRIGINAQMFKLATESLTITRVAGSGFFNFQNTRQSSTNYRFSLYQGTSSSLSSIDATNNFDLGTGLEELPYTMWDLATDINALANYSCTLPTQTARVNGTQSNTTINVDAGHTITAGNYIVFWDYKTHPRHRGAEVISTTATSITIDALDKNLDVVDNQVIGIGAVPAAFYPVDLALTLSSSSTATLNFDWWKYVTCPAFTKRKDDANNPFFLAWNSYRFDLDGNTPPVFVDADNDLYIFYPDVYFKTNLNYPVKYDSQNVYLAGEQTIAEPATIGFAAGLLGAGVYKYLIRAFTIDHHGNEILGKIDSIFPKDITVAALNQVQFSASISLSGLNNKGGVKDTTQTSNTIRVDDGAGNPHSFEVGDYATFRDSTNNWRRIKVTASNRLTAPYTITLAESVTVNDGENMSNGHGVLIYRSLAGGNELYEVGRYPLQYNNAVAYTWVDNFNDTVIETRARFEELGFGKEVYSYKKSETEQKYNNYSLPPCSFGALHQGLLVMGGDLRFPNTVYKTSLDRMEVVSELFGNFNVPSTVQGALTCLASNSDDLLISAKKNSLFGITGDLEENTINIDAITEGDYGTSSPLGLNKVKGVIRGIGELGTFKIENNQLALEENIYLEGSLGGFVINKKDLQKARILNDSVSKGARFFIPGKTNSQSRRHFVLDYFNKNIWFDWKYSQTYQDPNAGFGTYNQIRYHANLFSGNYDGSGFNWKECGATNNFAENYTDGTEIIPYRILSTHIHANTPKLNKTFNWLTFFSFLLDNEITRFTGFTLLVKTYRNFQASTAHTQKQISFSSTTEIEQPIRLKDGKAKSLAWEITNVNAKECPYLTGWELLTTENYDLDNHEK